MSSHLHQAFLNFAKAAIPEGAHPAQQHSMEIAFMAGSVSTFQILLDAFENNPEGSEDLITELHNEHQEFTTSLKASRVKPRRTDQEIIDRIKVVTPTDWLGVMQAELVGYLSYEAARPFVKDTVSEELWNEQRTLDPMKAARDYLGFAWDKANSCRGLSAGRSLDHLSVHLWMAGYDELVSTHFNGRWNFYGKPQLVIASILCNFPWTNCDDSRWVNSEEDEGLLPVMREIEISKATDIAQSARGH